MKAPHEEILEKYSFKRDKPQSSQNNYTVWQGTQKQTNVPVTIKLLKYPHLELPKYLKKLKEVRSDFIVKIFEVSADQVNLLLITEQITFGSLKKALSVCQRLDENDSIFLARAMLNGHVEILRADSTWFGNEEDIEFTDSGLKLSWNNGCQFNLINPFPTILARIANRVQNSKETSLLPFPEIKAITELIKVCKENASQISLHPQMKQKIKFARRKGKGWMGLREIKTKNEYFDELSYFGVSNEWGFVRVKVYDVGQISPNLLALNKSKTSFTKVLDVYDEADKTIIISDYANDGNLQNYVKRLKTAGVSLKQDQIQFFFYSLFDPIKGVQESTLKSINMMHIRNIHIEGGIPKIGQPIPLNQKINEILSDRSDVPDFYHSQFKKDPTTHSPSYDTYSLGVLLYKLMYTEYPIFPNAKVHIPTTPSYNKRLKTSLEILLNQGGSLIQLEAKIEVGENVLKQIKSNKQKLEMGNVKTSKKVNKIEENQEEEEKVETASKISLVDEKVSKEGEEEQEEDDDDEETCCKTLLQKLVLAPAEKLKKKSRFIDVLEESPYRKCRIWTKVILSLIMYIFLFYLTFFINGVDLFANQNILSTVPVTIGSSSYSIISTSSYNFQSNFSKSNQTITDLNNMNCFIDNYNGGPQYSSILYDTSSKWLAYIISAALFVVLILILKVIQINVLDEIRALYNRQNGIGKFNFTNYIIISLLWNSLINSHFFIYNFIYYQQTDPCAGYSQGRYFGSSSAFFSGSSSFLQVYCAVFISQILFTILYLIFIGLNEKIRYNKILNPITIFGLGLFIFTLIVRFGAILKTYYFPSAANDSNAVIKSYFNSGNLVGILGILPEILLLIEILIAIVIDLIFWACIDKSHSLLNNDSIANGNLEEMA